MTLEDVPPPTPQPLITVCTLIYRSPVYLTFVLDALARARNVTPFATFVMANDPTDEVAADPRVNAIHRNADPSAYWATRTYHAWNAALRLIQTPFVALINSDMAFGDYWLDYLYHEILKGHTPSSLLVESGAIPSAFPEYVADFGTPPTFRWDEWMAHAAKVREPFITSPGRLPFPMLINRHEVLALGGFRTDLGTQSADRDLVARIGRPHVTAHGSVLFHTMRGEQRA